MMAFEYDFVQKPSGDHFCPVCTDLLTDPFLIIQCGHHLCGTCRDRLIASRKKECPVCRVPHCLQGAAPNLHMKRQVDSLMVHCEHHSKGCTWTGELRNLQEHLNPARRKCDYVLVKCSFGCGQQVRSGEMKVHNTSRVSASSDQSRASTVASTINAITSMRSTTQNACSSLWTVRTNAK